MKVARVKRADSRDRARWIDRHDGPLKSAATEHELFEFLGRPATERRQKRAFQNRIEQAGLPWQSNPPSLTHSVATKWRRP
jgi:hypothetical protein